MMTVMLNNVSMMRDASCGKGVRTHVSDDLARVCDVRLFIPKRVVHSGGKPDDSPRLGAEITQNAIFPDVEAYA
jgi:hypothetical protein